RRMWPCASGVLTSVPYRCHAGRFEPVGEAERRPLRSVLQVAVLDLCARPGTEGDFPDDVEALARIHRDDLRGRSNTLGYVLVPRLAVHLVIPVRAVETGDVLLDEGKPIQVCIEVGGVGREKSPHPVNVAVVDIATAGNEESKFVGEQRTAEGTLERVHVHRNVLHVVEVADAENV